MWIFLALGMVVLAHLFAIGLAMMALAAAAGVVLYLTRPVTAQRPAGTAGNHQPSRPSAMPVPRQFVERTTEPAADLPPR